jgi:hypothetical protein
MSNTNPQPFNLTMATVQCLAGLQKDLDSGLQRSTANQNFLHCVQAAVQQDETPGEGNLTTPPASATSNTNATSTPSETSAEQPKMKVHKTRRR